MEPINAEHISPFCSKLRTKKLLFLTTPPKTEGEIMDGSGACWCEESMHAVGPDHEPVDPGDCRRGRTCFQPIV